MSTHHATNEPFDLALAAVPRCALDERGIREQRSRYASLARSVLRVSRQTETVLVEFDETLDRDTLAEALDVERACCPFFRFDFDQATRQLQIAVEAREQVAALDALADALGAGEKASGSGGV